MNDNLRKVLFAPDTVAVIGASDTPGSWGFGILQNVLRSGKRRVYPVHPKASEIMGIHAYPSVLDIPGPVDHAIVVISAERVPKAFRECAKKGIKSAVVISGGFAEIGGKGRAMEEEMVRIARQAGLRFIGPNTMGHADTSSGFSSFAWAPEIAPGPVGLISQSGNYSLRVVETGMSLGIGFSKIVVVGNEADLHSEDYLECLAQDDHTKIICVYLEGLRGGRNFIETCKRVSSRKPIVAVKVGTTKGAARAVSSHTGAMAGADEVYGGAFKQAGVIRVADDDELCDVVQSLLNQPLPRGNRVGIMTIGGGLGVVTAEACEKEGLDVPAIADSTIKKLDSFLPPRWSRTNPVDMVGLSMAELPAIFSSLWVMMEDEGIDSILLIGPVARSRKRLSRFFGEQEVNSILEADERNLRMVRQKVLQLGKPVILIRSPLDLNKEEEINQLLRRTEILSYASPTRAAKVLRNLAWYGSFLRK